MRRFHSAQTIGLIVVALNCTDTTSQSKGGEQC
jgi:hypothetical protein